MDTFVDSSWYFMRYCDAKNSEQMVADGAKYWMPMDQYIGGVEHAILHLLYARFWTKVMRDLGLLQVDEPFTKLLTQGMVLNHIYSRRTAKGGKEYFWPKDVEHVHDEAGKIIGAKLKVEVESADGLLPVGTAIDYEGVGTMSKSKNNGVDPQDLIEKYGADTARLYTMFTAPPELTLEWNEAAVEGSYRFLRRVYNFGHKLLGINYTPAIMLALGLDSLDDVEFGKDAKALRLEIHTVLKQIDYDYQRMQYNTVVSGAMKIINALEGFKGGETADGQIAMIEGFGILLRVLYPATPTSHVLWKELGYANKQGDILMPHGPRWIPRPWCRTSWSWCCRSTASCVVPSACLHRLTRPRLKLRPWPTKMPRSSSTARHPRRSWSFLAVWSTSSSKPRQGGRHHAQTHAFIPDGAGPCGQCLRLSPAWRADLSIQLAVPAGTRRLTTDA